MIKGIASVFLVFLMVLSLVACGTTSNKQSLDTQKALDNSASETSNETSGLVVDTNSPEPKSHSEYVITYSVYAEEGAVVTWFDPQTGEFKYNDKCETCGQICGGEHL